MAALAAGGPTSAQDCSELGAGAVAWWSLDESSEALVSDRVGGHAGAHANGSGSCAGQVRGAACFDGVNDFVQVPDDPLWNLGAGDFTIELWARFDSPGGGSVGHPSHIFLGNDEGPGNARKWFFALGGGFLNFHVNGPSLGPQFFPLVPFAPVVGQWYHLAVVREGSLFTSWITSGTRCRSPSSRTARRSCRSSSRVSRPDPRWPCSSRSRSTRPRT